MIENKYRFLIRLVRYSRDRGLLFLSSQTGMNAQNRGRAKLQIKIRWRGALVWSAKNYFRTGTQQGALRVVPRLCVLPISRAAYCCSDFVMSAWSAWDKLKLLALQSFFNLLSRSCHMLIRLIKITKCQWLLVARRGCLLSSKGRFIRSDEHCRTTYDGIAGNCLCSDFQFVPTACNAIFPSTNRKLSLPCSLHCLYI